MSDWFEKLKNSKRTCLVHENLKKVHYDFENGTEMVEEYNTETGVLTRRAWKRRAHLEAEGRWEIEIGDPEPKQLGNELVIQESSSQPFVSRRVTKRSLEWRIRNLPYALETYSVTADQESNCLVVRTTNKKYFKKLDVPELERTNLVVEQDEISFSHKFNTLIITYRKPTEVTELEKKVYEEVKKLKPKGDGGDNCKPS